MKLTCIIFALAVTIVAVWATPKKYTPGDDVHNGFQPSNRYYESNLNDQSRNATAKDVKDAKESTAVNRYQRFGSVPGLSGPGYGNTGAGVPGYPPHGGGVSYMTPMKIDIGGVALGAILGLGAVLIAPKLLSIFHMVGPAYRSLDSSNSSVTDILARIDSSLEQHNIDSSSCMQRVICSYVHEAQKNIQNNEANSIDEVVFNLSNNALFSYMLDGSAVKQAIDMGKTGDLDKCANLYVKCPISRENVMQIITSLLPPA